MKNFTKLFRVFFISLVIIFSFNTYMSAGQEEDPIIVVRSNFMEEDPLIEVQGNVFEEDPIIVVRSKSKEEDPIIVVR